VKLLVDSSTLAKRYVLGESSAILDRLLQRASELAICIILVPELICAKPEAAEQVLTTKDYGKIKRQLPEDVKDTTVLQVTPAVISQSVRLLETRSGFKTLDHACGQGAGRFESGAYEPVCEHFEMHATPPPGVRRGYENHF
jgi:hypothetical protein